MMTWYLRRAYLGPNGGYTSIWAFIWFLGAVGVIIGSIKSNKLYKYDR